MTATLEAPASTAGDAYRDALEQVCSAHRDFAAFLKGRITRNHCNAAAYEAKTGRLAHKDRAAAAEVQDILRQFERLME